MSDQSKSTVADAPAKAVTLSAAESQKNLSDALKRAAQSGMAGASAMAINVTTLMWSMSVM
jgi:hypothetical protein